METQKNGKKSKKMGKIKGKSVKNSDFNGLIIFSSPI